MPVESYRFKWRYQDDERPQGCCYDCRMKYSKFPDMHVPDRLWTLINPTVHDGAGLLCPTCIANRLDYLGEWTDFDDTVEKAFLVQGTPTKTLDFAKLVEEGVITNHTTVRAGEEG